LRTTTHLVRRSACAAALALLATGAASAPALAAGTSPALAATTSPTTLAPGDGAAGDLFGESAATSSNGAVTAVGSPEHNSSGAVYVFTGTGTTFSQTAELTPSNPQADEQFGQTVAISGNGQTLVAAAPGAAGAGASDQGAAYVFTDQAGAWTQTAELTVPGTAELGTSLAISANASTIVLGAPTSNNDNGEAFVFTKSGSTYVQTQELTEPATAATSATRAGSAVPAARKPATALPPVSALRAGGLDVRPAAKKPKPAPQPPAFLGDNTAISSDGSTIAFGEPNVGVTDVFTKAAGASTWTQTAQLSGGGDSVAVSSNGAIVAAGQTGINNLNGAVFVFTKSGATFTKASEVLPPANTTIAAFAAGTNIGMSSDGSVIAFGAPTANAGTVGEAGAVFVATETSAGTWTLTATDTEPHPASGDDLGGGDQSVAVVGNGSAIVAGARVANATGQALVFPVS
jgi:FG-GAP repeat protein